MTTPIERLHAAIAAQTVKDTLAISDEAWDGMMAQLEVLRNVTPRELGVWTGSRGHHEPHDAPEEAATIEGLRTFARYIAALFTQGTTVSEIAADLGALVGNPNLTHPDWVRVVEGRVGFDPSVVELRGCAMLLRAGYSSREAARRTGVSTRQSSQLLRFIGVAEYLRQARLAMACDMIERVEGATAERYRQQWNAEHPPQRKISTKTAYRDWAEARRIMSPTEPVAVGA